MERFTISLDDQLAQQFDGWMVGKGYANRSEAVRDLLRAEIGKERLTGRDGNYCVACLSYVFNHHERDLAERLTALHHQRHDLTVSTMHAHLDHDHCMETVILRGPTTEVSQFADALCAERGVHHGKLNIISVTPHAPHARHSSHGTASVPHVHLKPTT